MVARYYGLSLSSERIRDILGYTPIGTPAGNVIRVERLGINVRFGYARDERVLLEAVQRGIPPICFVDTASLSYWRDSSQHAVVVVDVGVDRVSVNDPAHADNVISVAANEFMLSWTDMDMMYALLTA